MRVTENLGQNGFVAVCVDIFHHRGRTPLPDDQISLRPKSPVLGGKLNFDAYNNGGEWLNSVHDVGPNLVSVNWESLIQILSLRIIPGGIRSL